MRTAKALARLHGCAGSPEPSLVAYAISIIISRAGSHANALEGFTSYQQITGINPASVNIQADGCVNNTLYYFSYKFLIY